MSLSLYNTLTKKKEEFRPLSPGRINMYACGVTVYDNCHIGHARSLYLFESFRRYLINRGYRVKFIRNITDIDDKIINRAKELNIPFNELTKEFIARYYKDLESLGISKASIEPRATEHIKEMIKMIEGLIKKGFAYESEGDVYFKVRNFKEYGKLSGQGIEAMQEAVRIEKGEKKTDPLDFALWKKSKEGEPFWNSPWGKGRPGWHIECSVMSTKYLGESFDIHAGGLDLVFPHHENEIAQAEASTGKQFARYWMHCGLLTINGQKMSKSLNNFISISKFLEKYHPDILKLFFLSCHYSSPLDYNLEKIDEIRKSRERLIILLDRLSEISGLFAKKTEILDELSNLENEFNLALDDDFNTAKAQGFIFEIVNIANKIITDDKLDKDVKKYNLLEIKKFLGIYKDIFGLSFEQRKKVDERFILEEIKKRDMARKNKDYKLADDIRNNLHSQGVILEDDKGKTTWRIEE